MEENGVWFSLSLSLSLESFTKHQSACLFCTSYTTTNHIRFASKILSMLWDTLRRGRWLSQKNTMSKSWEPRKLISDASVDCFCCGKIHDFIDFITTHNTLVLSQRMFIEQNKSQNWMIACVRWVQIRFDAFSIFNFYFFFSRKKSISTINIYTTNTLPSVLNNNHDEI